MAKILLVEDDNNLREIFQMRLQAEGYTTVVAADGEEGLVVAMKEKPDLIIADIMMPKLSGFEMIESLRASPELKDTKVVMMTALGQAEDQARGEKLGVVKYLVKSQVTLEDFARVVKEVLGPGTVQGDTATKQVDSLLNNQQESERQMQDDQASNPTPNPADSPAPAANPMGDTPSPAGAPDAGAAPAAPADPMAASTGGDAPTPPPASEPGAAPTPPPAGTDTPPAGDPTSSAL